MSKTNNHEKFLKFRHEFPFFVFENQEYSLSSDGLSIKYFFNLSGKYLFNPEIFIPRNAFFLSDEVITGKLDSIVFHIGMIELISYWKACCSPEVIICPFFLSTDQLNWWKKLYFNGLGEFFYLNNIATGIEDFMHIRVNSAVRLSPQNYHLSDTLLIPVGGGKDSAVTLELLGRKSGSLPLIMNPRSAGLNTIMAAGYSSDNFFEIRRRLDPALLELNEAGFLNGHTPFSALLAFTCVLASILTGHRHIALSNESSANDPTIGGTNINHQYSKSFTFETDFRDYLRNWISTDINYFSFLRPINELQIARLFSQYRQYHSIFRSCNAGSKLDIWCGKCPKCLFTWIILSPFLKEEDLVTIFGKILTDDIQLKPIFEQLCGLAAEKPFDCIGTTKEVNLALCETIRKHGNGKLPELLHYYKSTMNFEVFGQMDFQTETSKPESVHYLTDAYLKILKAALDV